MPGDLFGALLHAGMHPEHQSGLQTALGKVRGVLRKLFRGEVSAFLCHAWAGPCKTGTHEELPQKQEARCKLWSEQQNAES